MLVDIENYSQYRLSPISIGKSRPRWPRSAYKQGQVLGLAWVWAAASQMAGTLGFRTRVAYILRMVNLQALPLWANGLVTIAAMLMVAFSAHWVVECSVRISKRLGVSELIVGLTVVALGTSAPEFVVTLMAAFEGHGDISIGNVVGSNIFNLGFILGGCALVRAIPTTPTLLRRDGTVIAAATVLLLGLVGWDLRLDRHDGVILFTLLGIYLGYLFKQRGVGLDRGGRQDEPDDPRERSFLRDGLMLMVGLCGIVGGSHVLIESAIAIASEFDVSEWVIGVTIVAAGTSAPEFATSLAGVLKGRYALSAGSVIGSDIFNLLGVLGLAGILRPMEIDPMARVSLGALCAMVFLVIFFIRTGWRISRLEGFALLGVAASRWGLDFLTRAPSP